METHFILSLLYAKIGSARSENVHEVLCIVQFFGPSYVEYAIDDLELQTEINHLFFGSTDLRQ